MAKFSILKNRFNLGQFSKRAFGLSNFDEYSLGADTVKNMIPMSYGGVRRRGGSRYINTTDTHYKHNTSGGSFGASSASSAYSEYSRLLEFKFKDSKGVLYLDGDNLRVSRWDWDSQATQNEYDQIVPTSHVFGTLTDFISGAGSNVIDPDFVKYTQVGDFMYIVSGGSCPFYVGWNGESSSSATIQNIFLNPTDSFDTDLSNRVPYQVNTNSSHTITNSATTGTITIF